MRTLRAFVWLRWRLLANALKGGQRRDRLEQISRAVAMIMPLLLIALSIGSVVGMTILGFVAGRTIITGLAPAPDVLVVVRIVLAFVLVVVVFFAFWLPTQSSLTRYTRLLLLPISRRTLHAVEFAAAVADPWVGFIAPGLLAFAVALGLGGLGAGAAVAAIAGLLLLASLAGIASLIGFLVSWLFRSRRRSELFTILFVVVLSLGSFVPALVSSRFETRQRDAEASGSFEEVRRSRDARRADLARWFGWSKGLPTELYGAAVHGALDGRPAAAAGAMALLGVEALLLFLGSSAMHARLIGSVEGRGRSRAGARSGAMWRLPLLSPAASAVASAQVRTALRSVRGRLALLLPGPLLAGLVIVFGRVPDSGRIVEVLDAHGHALLGAGMVLSIYSFQPFTMNLFGTDRAGLSLQFLLPVSAGDLTRGKLAGIGLALGATCLLCVVCALAVVPLSSSSLWLATLIGGAATYVWLAPVFIWMSALFPVAADLSKTGSGGNPHGLAMLVGTLAVPIVAIPAAALVLAADVWLDRPALAVPLMLAWFAVAVGGAMPLASLAARTVTIRRENLAMVAQGR